MSELRKYQEMTIDEKRHSIELWKRFYESLQEKNYENSWHYWNKRMNYLNDIGVKTEKNSQGLELSKYI
jgi:hypothetical protein